MIAVDTNLLIYAHRLDAPLHAKAAPIVASLAEGRAAWAIPWPCLPEFFGVTTNRRVFVRPTRPAAAIDAIEAWLESPTLQLLHESSRHWSVLKELLSSGRVDGPRVHDARIAALCLEHGVRELWSADRDFNRFPGLPVRNPLVD